MTIIAVGIDLAKNVFAVHGVNTGGKAVLVRPAVKRDALLELVAKLPPCLIGMEACSGAHYWAREFAKFGHDVRIIAPQPWLAFLQQGHGAKRNQGEPFEPYRQRDLPGMPLWCVDEPTRYENLKGTAKRAYVRKPTGQKKKEAASENGVDDTPPKA